MNTTNVRYCKSPAVKMLETLAMDEARRRYPTVPYLAPRTFRDDTAKSKRRGESTLLPGTFNSLMIGTLKISANE